MNRHYFMQGLTALLCGLTTALGAQVALPSVFTDHMVLQQQSCVPVWGWGYASQPIRVVGSWAPTDTVATTVRADGHWQVSIPTTSAGGPYSLQVIGDKTLTLQDVMLGEVWLCSGQSNMEWIAAGGLTNKEAEIAAADHPGIRFFHIPHRGAESPQEDCAAAWAACTPQTMPNTSAVAYFFARKLQEEKGVPVGLIVSAWGGTPAEVWTPADLVNNTPALTNNRVDKEYPWWPITPGVLYNQMIHPIVPYRIAGTIWYQGESNHEKYASYGLLMKKLIEGWRADFGKDMPFYFVQIAPYTYGSTDNTPALLREQQEFVSRLVPNTGMVVISDLVDDVKNIHPISKQQVGARLARLALAETYGEQLTDYRSPVYKSMEVKKKKAIISFVDADNGLLCRGKKVEGLQMAGADGVWQTAEGVAKGCTLEVSARGVKQPAQVRYCFDDATEGNLFTTAGLPVAPFRTDREMTLGDCAELSGNWRLTWEDNFDTTSGLDTASWSKIPRGRSDWDRHMSDFDSCYAVKDGNLVLRGIVNYSLPTDTAPYITGGVYTKKKVTFKNGRLEVRAKLQGATGCWPAIWLLPQTAKWPMGGEIDIMERLNNNSIAYQTVHSNYTFNLGIKDNPVNGGVGPIRKDDYNVYGVEMTPDSLSFFINECHTFTYPRIQTKKKGQYPFDAPFYLLIDMQLGGSWVGRVDKDDLPVEMKVDWVRFYQK